MNTENPFSAAGQTTQSASYGEPPLRSMVLKKLDIASVALMFGAMYAILGLIGGIVRIHHQHDRRRRSGRRQWHGWLGS